MSAPFHTDPNHRAHRHANRALALLTIAALAFCTAASFGMFQS